MRILHTADWHLGRVFFQESLLDDQAHLLEQVMRGVKDSHADVLIVAGDIFDRPNPKREAVAALMIFSRRYIAILKQQ